MENMIFSILLVLMGLFIGIILITIINYVRELSATRKADKIIETAKLEADKIKRDNMLECKEEAHRMKVELDKEIKERKSEIKDSEERLLTREASMDRRDQILQNREEMLEEKENNLISNQKTVQLEQAEVEKIEQEQVD